MADLRETRQQNALSGGMIVYNQSGEEVGNIPYGTDTAQAALSGKAIYPDGAGGYTSKLPKAYAEFDSKGDIVISAPKELLEMESFKKNVLDNYNITALSTAYKADPNTRFPDPDDDSKTISIDEQLRKLNEGLAQYTESAQRLIDERNALGPQYQGLSLDNVVTALSVANSDSDRQVIPQPILNRYASFFENLPSWDAETRSATKEDILKSFFSYDTAKRTELLGRYSTVNFAASYSDEVYDLMQSSEGKQDVAERLAFKRFLDVNDAVAETSTGINRKVAEVVNNELVSFAGQFSAGLMSALSLPGAAIHHITNGDVNIVGTDWLASNAEQLEESINFWNNESEVVNKTSAVVGDIFQTLGNLGAILVAEGAMGEVINKITAPLQAFTDAVQVLEYVDKNGDVIAKGASFAMKTLPSGIASGIAVTAANLIGATLKTVSFLGEVIVDAAVDTPQLMASIMSKEDVSQETRDTLFSEAAFNGLGLAAGHTFSKFLTGLGSTEMGKALNNALAVFNARIQTKASDVINNLRTGKATVSLSEKYAEKADLAEAAGKTKARDKFRRLEAGAAIREQLQDARKVLAGLSIKDTAEITEQINKIKVFEQAYDLVTQGSKQTYAAIIAANRIIRESDEAVYSALKNVIKAQRVAHLSAAAGKYGSSGLSTIGSQYVSATYRLELATRAAADSASTLNKAAQRSLPVYEEQVAKLIEQMTPEYKAALDIYAQKVKIFYNNMTDFATSNGLLSEKIIEGYRKTGLFSDGNYMRVVVESDVPRIRMERADGLIANNNLLDIKHLQFPEEAQKFVDPEVVRHWYGLEIAQAYNAKNLAESAIAATGATTTVLATDKEIRAAKNIKTQSKPVIDAIKANASKFVADIDKDISLKVLAELGASKTAVTKSKFALKGAQAKVVAVYRKAAVGNLTNEQLANIYKANGYQSGSALDSLLLRFGEDEAVFREWYSSANKNLKDWVKAQRNAYIATSIAEPAEAVTADNLVKKVTADMNAEKALKKGVTFEQFKELAEMDGFKRGFDEKFFLVSEKLTSDAAFGTAVKKAQAADEYVEGLTEAKASLKKHTNELNVSEKNLKKNLDEVKDLIRDSFDNYVTDIMANKKVAQNIYAIAEYSGAEATDVARYMILDQVRKKANLNLLHDSLYKNISRQVPSKATKAQINAYSSAINETVDSLIKEEFNNARLALDDLGSSIIDRKKWASEIEALQKKIAGTASVDNVIKMSDGMGGIQLVQVDPNLAFLYNYRPHRTVDTNIFSRFNRLTSRLFRFGTTTISSKSFINQLLRDSGNAYFMGNAWRSISESADNLVDVFGEKIVNEIKAFRPDNYEAIVSSLAKEGTEASTENIAREAVKDVQAMGEALSPASTETEIYRRIGETSDAAFERMQTQTRNIANKLDDIFNGKRERYLRNRVFMNGLNQAMEQGHSFMEAQKIATNLMQNATTNFSRSLMMLDGVAENVPYIRAAINGTTSFWRMWSLDPVGVTGRIMGGLFVPYTYLIGQSLADSENVDIYRKIPEYEKANAMVFVVRGQKISIPIPQEIGNFMAPFRQFVEYLYNANSNNFWELMANDVLGFSPIDLTGFSSIDMNVMTSDPTIFDRLNRGTTRLVSQLMPVPIKAAYIYMTGTDPYTGRRIANTSWTYTDPETGEQIPMGYAQGRFSENVAKMFNHDNPALLSSVISAILGETGEDFMDTLFGLGQVALGSEGADPDLISAVSNNLLIPQATNAAKVFYGESYNRIDTLWRQAIRELEVKKDSITNSKEWKDLQSQISQATSETAITKLRAKRKTIIESFTQEVVNTVKRLQSEYEGTYDRSKYAATLQLLNFSTNADFDIANAHLKELASESYYAGQNQAIRTLQEMGVQGVGDASVFGYLRTQKDGSVSIRYNQPTAILDIANVYGSSDDIEVANLTATLKKAGLTTSARYTGYQNAKTKAQKNAFKTEWNAKVIEAIEPYVRSVGVDELLSHSSVVDYLDNIIYVNNPYKAKDYIRSIFKG